MSSHAVLHRRSSLLIIRNIHPVEAVLCFHVALTELYKVRGDNQDMSVRFRFIIFLS